MKGQTTADDDSELTEINPADVNVDDRLSTRMSRRQMMITTGAVAGTVALGAGAGSVAASETVDFSSDLAHDSLRSGEMTVAETTDEMAQLEWINDNGDVVSLNDDGIVLESVGDDEPNNPVGIQADLFESEEYTEFPRGETVENADGEEEDVHWYQTGHWDDADAILDQDGKTLTVSGSPADGTEVSALFDQFSIDSGVRRKRLQAVLDVETLGASATVEFRVGSSDSTQNDLVAVIDPAGDPDAEHVLTTSEGASQVAQVPIAELGDLDDIESLEIAVLDDTATVTLLGFNLQKEEDWEFGSREYENADGDLTTEIVTEPSGRVWVQDLGGISLPYDRVRDVSYKVEQRASELPASATYIREEETERHDRDTILEIAHVYEWPTGYDLSSSIDSWSDEQTLSSSRYMTVEFAEGVPSIESMEDVDDIEEWTSRTGRYDELDGHVDITQTVDAGQRDVLRYELNLDSEDVDAMITTASSGVGGAGAASGGGGIFSMARTVFAGLFVGLAARFAWARRKASSKIN